MYERKICTQLKAQLDFFNRFLAKFVKWQRQQQVSRYKEIKNYKDFSLKLVFLVTNLIKLLCVENPYGWV